MNENEYEKCEEKVLELFEDLNIISFPINPFYIAEKMKILLVKYSDFGLSKYIELAKRCPDGFNLCNRNENRFYIYYNDFQDPKRIRQIIMHEIGHIYSDRNSDTDEDETFATHFAGYSLCPTPLLIEMDLDDFDFDLIKNMFDISNQATDTAIGIKLRRIFVDSREGYSDYENKIIKRFSDFIKKGCKDEG